MEKYDLTIIGGGSGGLTAARTAASLGAHVLLVDKERLGGDCLNYGCVPSKSLLHVARVVQQARTASLLGLQAGELDVDIARVSDYIQGVIARVGEGEQVYSEAVDVKFGHIAFKSATVLTLDREEFGSRNTLIATGSHPALPHIEGLAETGYLTNEGAFDLQRLPASLLVLGGGPVGVELGQAFERLGSRVTIIQGPGHILPRDDPEMSELIASVLRREGIEIVTHARVVKAARSGTKKAVTARREGQTLTFAADEILLALGRRPNIDGLNLEAAGVKYDARVVQVNEYLQTSAANILAIGDAVGGHLFTHVVAYQAGVAVRNALLPFAKKKVDYRVLPWCTFSDPEAARVGLTPGEAEKQHRRVRIVKIPWTVIDRAQAENEITGFIKLVLAGKKEEIVGAHMVGLRAGELLGEMALAMRHNLSVNDILNTIHAYPTLSTGIQQAVFEAYLQGNAAAKNRRLVRTFLKLRR